MENPKMLLPLTMLGAVFLTSPRPFAQSPGAPARDTRIADALATDEQDSPEAGSPPIRILAPVPQAAVPQAWASIRAADGSIWLAQSDRNLHRYDGAVWSRLGTPTVPRALVADASGTVYWSGFGEIGRIDASERGQPTLTSLAGESTLPAPTVLGDLKRAVRLGDRLVFQSARCTVVLEPDGRSVRHWSTDPQADPFAALGVLHDTLHVVRARSGVEALGADDTWTPVLVAGAAPLPRVIALTELEGTPWVISESGRLLSGDGESIELAEDLPGVVCLAALADQGAFHLATASHGLVCIVPGSEAAPSIVDERSGLPSNKVHGLRRDVDGTLWLATNRGTAIVRTDSAWSRFGPADGIHGRPLALVRHQGQLHVGTDEGLFRLEPETGRDGRPHFVADPRFPIGCWQLLDFDDSLIACVPPRIMALSGAESLTLLEQSATTASRSWRDRDVLFVAGAGGLFRLRRLADGWTTAQPIDIACGRILSIEAAADGSLWMQTEDGELLCVQGAETRTAPSVRRWPSSEPGRLLQLGPPGTIGLGSDRRIFRLDPAAAPGLPPVEAFEQPFAVDPEELTGIRAGTALPDGRLLLSSARSLQVLDSVGSQSAITRDIVAAGPARQLLYESGPHGPTIWAARDHEILRISLDELRASPRPAIPAVEVAVTQRPPVFGSGRGALRIDIAPARPGFEAPPRYRVRLVGVDPRFDAWRTETSRRWSRVPTGTHRIDIEMRTADGTHQLAWSTSATIARPLPGRPLLWLAGLLLLAMLGLLGSRIAAWRLKRRNESLADEVAQRTEQLDQQRTATERSAAWLATTFHRCPAALLDVDASAVRKALDALIENGATDVERHLEKHPEEIIRVIEGIRLNEVNDAALELAGAPDLASLQERLPQLFTNDTLAMVARMFGQLMRGAASFTDRSSLMSFDGRPLHVGIELAIPPGYERSWERLILAILDRTAEMWALEESRALESRAHEMSKLEGLGRLAGGVAHDFNNLLTAIAGNLEALKPSLPKLPDTIEATSSIELATRRGAELCEQLLAFAGRGVNQTERVDLSEITSEMVRVLRRSLHEKAVLSLELAEDPPSLRADPTRLRQIILNLIVNASESLPEDGGAIIIRTRVRALDRPRPVRLGEEVQPGRYVVLEVLDDGCGIAAERLDHIFDPFFSTKGMGRGLGMAAVVGNLQAHGGFLEIDSEVDEGTHVRIWLPIEGEPGAASTGDPGPSATPQSTDTEISPQRTRVAVTDPDADVRRVAARLLRAADYDAMEAADWRDALPDDSARPDAPSVLLVDERHWEALQQHLANRADPALRPGIVMIRSGIERPGRPDQDVVTIHKPFRQQDLVDAVERARAARSPGSGSGSGRNRV